MIPIFLSRPNPFLNAQEYFLDNIMTVLKKLKFIPKTLTAKDYSPYESIDCINKIIKRCYGTIIIAYGQSYVEKGISKKGAISKVDFFDATENLIDGMWITSPFCQIEGIISFNNELPIIIFSQKEMKIEGILKEGEHAFFCPNFDLDSKDQIDAYFKDVRVIKTIDQWANEVNKLFTFVERHS